MEEDLFSPDYNPRVIFPVQRVFLQKTINIEGNTDAMVCKYDEEGNYLTLGCKDGSIRALSVNDKYTTIFKLNSQRQQQAVTCISLTSQNKTLKNSLIATYSDGRLGYWHLTSKQLLSLKEHDKMLYCCGFSSNGTTYSYAGEDCNVYVQDLGKNNTFSMTSGKFGKHSNRIYCTKWHPEDPNLFYSGGWDSTVYLWDRRVKQAVDKVNKATIGGESIDIKDNILLLGNLQQEYQIKLYDIKAGKLMTGDWLDYSKKKSMIVSAAFLTKQTFVAGSIITNQIRMFKSKTCNDIVQLTDQPIYSIAVSPNRNQFAVSTGNHKVHIFNY